MDEISEFYDELRVQYHLLYADWDEAVARHGRVVGSLIGAMRGLGPKRILDAACEMENLRMVGAVMGSSRR